MLWAILIAGALAAGPVTGTVKDSNGGVVAGASVSVRTPTGAEQQTTTAGDGTFSIEVTAGATATIIVRAEGFAEAQQPLTSDASSVEIILSPATVFENVVVSATRTEQRLGNVPASVNVLSSEQINTSPAVVADDVLRQVPSFSLFRRTSSLFAQPTTQGVSLRGIGPSGQSRTLVLLDGIPFNDPFGGWVYWTRVPLLSVNQIEISEDAGSSLYGNIAMGGVINIMTARPTRQTIELKPQYGNLSSPKFDFLGSDRWNNMGALVEGSFFSTNGSPIVAAREMGPIDNNADVAYQNVTGKFEYDPAANIHARVRGAYFSEKRNNAKIGEYNSTQWATASGLVRAILPDSSTIEGQLFADNENSHYTFLAVTNSATTRNAVRLATDQHVPVNGVGGSLQWTKVIGTKNVFTAGADTRRVSGDSQEDAYVAGTPAVPGPDGVTLPAVLSVQRVSGGAQRSMGAFISDIFTPTARLVLTLSARADSWKNYSGHNLETSVSTGLPTANNRDTIPDRSDSVVSPRVAALYHLTEQVTAWGAFNSGFRAPTLTELYRQFSVGAVTTLPNSGLGPERLYGSEAGINIAPIRNLTTRFTYYDNRIKDPISNVTLTATTAQKMNLGETRVRGLQMDAEYRVTSSIHFSGAYILNDAKVVDDGGLPVPSIVGNWIPQVPKHRGSLQATYTNPKYLTASLSIQFTGMQYNDDQNTNAIPAETLSAYGYDPAFGFGLPGYTSVDLSVARDLGRSVQLFGGIQNLTNKVYFVQTGPSTIGTPRLVNVGVRVRFAGK
ncbi:MAG: TonB-dependent receptor [Acidobacteriaceae bacterium]|jgi:outer membrane receptor protein involved in Fe transport|nr:TonB-dependent receptor [Acidobacteriaceae bacterium]